MRCTLCDKNMKLHCLKGEATEVGRDGGRLGELESKTPLTEEVEAMYDPTKERFRAQNYRADLELQKLKECR